MTKLDTLKSIEALSYEVLIDSLNEFRDNELAIAGATAVAPNLQSALQAWHTNLNTFKEELAVVAGAVAPAPIETPVADIPSPAADVIEPAIAATETTDTIVGGEAA